MKGSTFKRVFILIVLAVVVITIPKLMQPILASPSSLVKSVKFVRLLKPNDDPFASTPINVNDDDIIRIQNSNYYVNFDWEKLASDVINAGESFQIDVSGGMLIAETTTPHPLTVTSSTSPGTIYPSIGTIEVKNTTVNNRITSRITVTFNDKVNSNEIKTLGDLRGTVYLLSTINLNNPDIIPTPTAPPSWEPIIHPKIEVLNEPTKTSTLKVISGNYAPTNTTVYKNGNEATYGPVMTKIVPGRTIEIKTTIGAPYGLKFKLTHVEFKYNDFIAEYLKGNLSKREGASDNEAVNIAPMIDGVSLNNTDYTYTVTPSGFARSLEHKESKYVLERDKAIASSKLVFNNLPYKDGEYVITYHLYTSGTYVFDGVFSPGHYVTFPSWEYIEYENVLIDKPFIKVESIGVAKKGNVEISYVYVDPNTNQSKEVMPKFIDKDVLTTSTTYDNYVMPDPDKIKLLAEGYVFKSAPPTLVIKENDTVPFEIKVDKAYTDVTLKFEYTDTNGNKTYPVNDATINNIWIKDPSLADYKLTPAQKAVLDNANYELVNNTINLNVTSVKPADNIFIVPIKPKGSVTTTTSNTTTSNTTTSNTTTSNTTTSTTTSNTTTSNTTTSNATTTSNTTVNRTTSNISDNYYGGDSGRPNYNTRREPSNTTSSKTSSSVITDAPSTTANWPNTSIVWPSEPPKTTIEITTNPPTFAPSVPTAIPRTSGTVINTVIDYTTPPLMATETVSSTTKVNPDTNDNSNIIKIILISLLATILVILIKSFKTNKR